MLKFNSVLFLVILCGGLQLSCGEKIKCEFRNDDYDLVGYLYECKVTSLDNSFDNMTIDGYTGVHMASENDKDVKAIYIDGTNTKYIPAGLGSLFRLTAFVVERSKLVEIKAENFRGMQNLEFLSLYNNKLTSVPSDAFSSMKNVKEIILQSNQIKYIGSGVFDQLTNLNEVFLNGNICVNKDYMGTTAITQMKEDLKVNCLTSTERMLIQIETKFVNEVAKANEKNQEELKVMNAMMEQLLKESKEHQMERQENINLRAQLSLAKDQQKKESSEARETMKQTINDLNTELIELKNQRQLEKNTYMGLRSKLMEAKEQLATCEINERS